MRSYCGLIIPSKGILWSYRIRVLTYWRRSFEPSSRSILLNRTCRDARLTHSVVVWGQHASPPARSETVIFYFFIFCNCCDRPIIRLHRSESASALMRITPDLIFYGCHFLISDFILKVTLGWSTSSWECIHLRINIAHSNWAPLWNMHYLAQLEMGIFESKINTIMRVLYFS